MPGTLIPGTLFSWCEIEALQQLAARTPSNTRSVRTCCTWILPCYRERRYSYGILEWELTKVASVALELNTPLVAF